MGSPHATEAQIRHFWALIGGGVNPGQAALQVNMSRQWGYRKVQGIGTSKTMAQFEQRELDHPEPKSYHELDDGIQEMLRFDGGFSLFCAILMLRDPVPWREDAAKRTVEALMDPAKSFIVANEPPGSGKSTLFTHDIPAWLICGGGIEDPIRGRALRLMIGSAALPVSTHYVRRLRKFLGSNRPFYDTRKHRSAPFSVVQAFGRFKPRDVAVPWRENEFIVEQFGNIDLVEKEATCLAISYGTDFLGERCDFYSWDDLATPANERTVEARDLKEDWFVKQGESRLEPGGVGFLVGQRLGPDDLYRRRLKVEYVDEWGERRKKYTHIVYPAHNEKTCDGAHRQWDARAEGCLLDEERLPFAELEAKRQESSLTYRTLYQQEDVDPAGSLVDEIWLTGGVDRGGFTVPGCYDENRGFMQWPSDVKNLVNYVTVDPAAGAGYWAVMWWAISPETHVRYLIKGIRSKQMRFEDLLQYAIDRQTLTGILEDWLQVSVEQHQRIRVVVVEGNNAFNHLVGRYDHFKVWQRKWRVGVIKHNTQNNKFDEQRGVQALLPTLYRQGLKRIPHRIDDPDAMRFAEEMTKELTQYPMGSTWDMVMSDWFGEWNMPAILLSARVNREPDDQPDMRLAPYLQRQRIEVPTG